MAAPASADEIPMWPKTLCSDLTKKPAPEPVDAAESAPFAAGELGYRDMPGAAAFTEGSQFSSTLNSRLHADPLQGTAS